MVGMNFGRENWALRKQKEPERRDMGRGQQETAPATAWEAASIPSHSEEPNEGSFYTELSSVLIPNLLLCA